MKLLCFALTLSVLVISVGAIGCSEGAGSRIVKGKALDHKVLKLEPGASTEDVRSDLGSPRLERDLGGEEVLYYGPWLLLFADHGLMTRTRYYKSGWHRNINVKVLNRKVMKLRRGTSIEYVRKNLGTPEAIDVYQDAPRREVGYWYGDGRWRITFTDGKLEIRNRG
jgi:outer membrane protein assembly factor BamE (lipoprotein component of BamABCDE complex)